MINSELIATYIGIFLAGVSAGMGIIRIIEAIKQMKKL